MIFDFFISYGSFNEKMKNEELRLLFLHYFKLGESASRAAKLINKAWGEKSTTARTVARWYLKFRDGDLDLRNAPGQGPPSKLADNDLLELVESDPRRSVRELAAVLSVSHMTVYNRLIELNKTKKLDKWVPY